MLFINPQKAKGLLAASIWSLLLFGCAQSPEKVSDIPESTTEPQEPSTETVAAYQITANPYLVNPPTVSAGLRSRFDQGLLAMGNSDWQAAIAAFDDVIAQQNNLSGAHLNRGICLEKLEQWSNAKSSFETALQVNANNVFAHNRLGLWHRHQGQFEQAQSHYQNALTIWPDYLAANKNLAILLDLYLHQPEQALPYYEHAALLIKTQTGSEDRQVKGWIIELKRRLKSSS